TDNSREVEAAIQSLHFEAPPPSKKNQVATNDEILQVASAVWDTIWLACDRIFNQPGVESKKIILLISDGDDTFSHKQIRDEIKRANETQVAIFSIGVGDKKKFGLRRDLLSKISEETGGRAFFPQSPADFQTAFDSIDRGLHSQYVVTYIPSAKSITGHYRK